MGKRLSRQVSIRRPRRVLDRLRIVTEARQIFGRRPAAELWVRLGLPLTPAMKTLSPTLQGELPV